jgi:cytochrome c biogenesis protein CcdA/thiol-disulfide isomerase/thioredoxin
MLIYVLAYLGGALTILSPCVLPVLPFVFANVDRSFKRNSLPLLGGMALTFSVVAVAAAFGGHWIVQLNQGGRYVAMVIFFILGITLIFPSIAEKLTHPLVQIGGRLQSGTPSTGEAGIWKSLLLGVSTGLLWAPCAGPILGLILTGAAVEGPGTRSSVLLMSFAAGAATSLGLALLAGNKVFATLKKSLGFDVWFRRVLGVAVIFGVVAIGLGWDTGLLTKFSFVNTAKAEEHLIDKFGTGGAMHDTSAPAGDAAPRAIPLSDEGAMPDLDGAVGWINSQPLTRASLAGKVVVIDFWTYSCINCLRALPYVEAWSTKYKNDGLVVIGVHTPEFAFEKDRSNIEKAVKNLGVTYPVAIDSDYKIWQAFHNQYWPAHYFIDAKGRIRHHHFGEGEYDQSERVIQQLLAEAGAKNVGQGAVNTTANGVEAAPSNSGVHSPETYIGYERSEHFVSVDPIAHDKKKTYAGPGRLSLNQWGLDGSWTVGQEMAVLQVAPGKIVFRFHARDLHLVLGPAKGGKVVRFKVKLDGSDPGADRGVDVAPDGSGTVQENRLYQLIRQKGAVEDRTFEIDFLDPGVQAFAFTFG